MAERAPPPGLDAMALPRPNLFKLLAVSATYPKAVAIARRESTAKVVTYAVNGKADYRADDERFSADGAHFRIHAARKKSKELLLPMSGYHNVENAAGVYAAARSLGVSHDQVARGFETFAGVKRRQEVRGEPGGVPAHGGASPPSGPGRGRNEPDGAEERVEPPRRGAQQYIPGDPQRDGGAQYGECEP